MIIGQVISPTLLLYFLSHNSILQTIAILVHFYFVFDFHLTAGISDLLLLFLFPENFLQFINSLLKYFAVIFEGWRSYSSINIFILGHFYRDTVGSILAEGFCDRIRFHLKKVHVYRERIAENFAGVFGNANEVGHVGAAYF